MAATDSPLKRLVTTFIDDFAPWLLESEVSSVTPYNIELYAEPDPIRADQVFVVQLADERTVILHIEFQGRRTEIPMKLRELDYLSRLALKFRDIELYSVVFYVGKGAGRHDTGKYQIKNPAGGLSLSWEYKVIRLWETKAQKLLALGKPALLGLIGQTEITEPKVLLPEVVAQVKTVSDAEEQKRLFTEMMLLIDDKEILNMLERLIEEEGLLLDTPMMRRLRNQGHEDALKEGFQSGLEKGKLEKSRHDLLKTLDLRFDPKVSIHQKISDQLDRIESGAILDSLFTAALQCQTIADFQTTLNSTQKPH
ncbi:MAG: hypothetical protein VSS75_029220 [Candidatus Parabeggiatoa sp.]|nr:hypothetical protein [Candidatus Parabeggiatoa sp.]